MNKSNRKTRKPMSLRRSMTILRKQMPELAKRYRVKSLGVFGSYVRHEQTRRSDLDILVEFDQAPDLLSLWISKNISPGNSASKWIWCRATR
jgi:predicted nucleotidyltransferase